MNTRLEMEEYRPISILAIVALCLGCTSALSLLTPMLSILGGVAVFIGLASLASIRRHRSPMFGRWLALSGIFLGILFPVTSITHQSLEREHRWQLAQGYADSWLQMIQEGNLEVAHHLTLPNHDRRGPQTNLCEFYAEENRLPDISQPGTRQPQTGFESYWGTLEPQRTIVADGLKCHIEFVGRERYENKDDGEYYYLLFRLHPADKELGMKTNVGENQQTIVFPLEFVIRLQRAELLGAGIQWHIHQVSIPGVIQKSVELFPY